MSLESEVPSFASLIREFPAEKIADVAGITMRAARRLKSGQTLPRERDLMEIAEGLGIDLATLLYVIKEEKRRRLNRPRQTPAPLEESTEIGLRACLSDRVSFSSREVEAIEDQLAPYRTKGYSANASVDRPAIVIMGIRLS